MSDKHKIVLTCLALFVLAWWFRYDTTCAGSSSGGLPCISYDRFTGDLIYTQEHIKLKED
jgi:hypothetical protein